MSLISSKISQASSSVRLKDIPRNSSLYAELHAYLSQKQIDTFASIAKDDIDDIKSYERVAKKEMIYLLENSEIQRKEEPMKILQRYFPKDPKTKSLYGQELLDFISQKIQDFGTTPYKGIVADNSVKHIARRISIQVGNKEEMIKEYLDEVRRNLLLNITHYEKLNTSKRSEMSDNIADDAQEAQPYESKKTVSEDVLSKAEDFLRELKKKDKM
ncbi:hypothetical protein H5410_052233 [Solanum commersonii]|uniref:Uncharacterized protein n=1 Tax=Solanum commersonii TaxID=4109 RepID=A0A9J5X314_SOLCO|nr:hypothetical protein H5410_052233 [Solanum commersonii]